MNTQKSGMARLHQGIKRHVLMIPRLTDKRIHSQKSFNIERINPYADDTGNTHTHPMFVRIRGKFWSDSWGVGAVNVDNLFRAYQQTRDNLPHESAYTERSGSGQNPEEFFWAGRQSQWHVCEPGL